MDDGRLVGRDGTAFPHIHKFRLPAGTLLYSALLPEPFDIEETHMCAVYDTQAWQPVKFEFRHKTGHNFFDIHFTERLQCSVEVVILKA